jgi:hypothetical protein
MCKGLRWAAATLLAVTGVVVAGCSNVVRLPDCVDCRPVEMSVDQTLEVELGSDRAVSSDPEAHLWSVTDTGTLELVSEERDTRPEDENEFIGGYSTYVVFSFEPTMVGTTQIQFVFEATDDPEAPPANVLDITVIVDE